MGSRIDVTSPNPGVNAWASEKRTLASLLNWRFLSLADRVSSPLERNYHSTKERTEMSDAATQTQMEHAPGSFCWIELATTDGPGAKKFYTELFGWEAQDSPIGPDMVYTMLKLNGKDVGALFQKGEMMKDVPTHWASYVSVNSADETVAKAKSLGGTIRQEAFDVMDVGRMAVITDPTGATFCIWEPKKHKGVGVKGETNSLCWNELLTNETDKAIDFYTKLFGWKTKTDSGATPYTEIINGEEHIGGDLRIVAPIGDMPPHLALDVSLPDSDRDPPKHIHDRGSAHLRRNRTAEDRP